MVHRRERRQQRKQARSDRGGIAASSGFDPMAQAATLLAAGDDAAARAALEKVLALQPDHADARFELGALEARAGNRAAAKGHYESVLAAAPEHAPALVNLAILLTEETCFADAVGLLRRAAAAAPEVALVHNNLGIALHRAGDLDDAIAAFERALDLAPESFEAANNLGAVFADLDRFEEAAACFERALALAPNFAPAHANLGNALNGLRRLDEAVAALEKAIALDPGLAFAHAKLATIHERRGDFEQAEKSINKAIELDNNDPGIKLIKGMQLRREKKYKEALEQIKISINGLYAPNLKCRAYFEAGHLYDRLDNPESAFEHFSAGNDLIEAKAVQTQVARAQFIEKMQDNLNKFTKEWVNNWSNFDIKNDNKFVFIIGFPRSGTTLLEQILDSHPGAQSFDEMPVVDDTINFVENNIGPVPECLSDLKNNEIINIQKVLIQEISKYIDMNTEKQIVCKLPLNLIHAGFIYRILPDAKFLFAERHPCDACLSCFMQHFTNNTAMTHFTSLDSTARFYALAMSLWRRYTEILPLDWYPVRYESMVDDFEGTVRGVLDFLGLPWDDAVREYDRHARSHTILTPSYSQVTQPIYTTAKERWRRYEKHLAPVLPVLQPFIEHFGYDAGRES
jgi:tetratricopeptide (TPR) repeat protein